jgi:hypothetical protein
LVHSILSHPISLRSILILSTHLRLGLRRGLVHSGFPTNILYAFLFAPFRATCPESVVLFQVSNSVPMWVIHQCFLNVLRYTDLTLPLIISQQMRHDWMLKLSG